MRHNRQTHRLGRTWSERKALLESLVSSLIKHQQIRTTLPKAKAAQRIAEKVITLGKADTLHARRQVFALLQDHQLTSKLFKDVAPRYKKREGGYTRILQLGGRRKGDGAQMAVLELTEKEFKAKAAPKAKKAAGKGHEHDEKPSKQADVRHPDKPRTEDKAKTFEKEVPGKKEAPKQGFFRNLGKFFRQKGGGA